MPIDLLQAISIDNNDRLTYMNTMNTLSERIAYLLELRGLSQSALAVKVGIKQPSVAAWLSGKTKKIEGENLLNTALALGVHPEWLATGQGPVNKDEKQESAFPRIPSEKDFVLIPQYTTKGACGNGYLNDHVELVGGLVFKRSWLERMRLDADNACVIYASGDSMYPSISDGDVLLLDKTANPLRSDEVYAFMVDDEVVVKRLSKGFGGIVLRGDNPNKAAYPDISVPPGYDLTVIGRVVWRGGGM
jgi:phage repressor protein C with HTH and peptisase S24 domain